MALMINCRAGQMVAELAWPALRGRSATSHHWEARSEHISAGSRGDGAGTAARSSRTRMLCFTATVRGLSGHWRQAGWARCRTRSAFVDANDAQAVMVGEVAEVLDVEGCQRQAADQARCGDPRIIDRAGTASPFGAGLQFTPADGDLVGVGERDHVPPPVRQRGQLGRPSVPQHGPLGELTDGDERDAPGLARQPGSQRISQATAQAGGGDVGIEDDEAHATSARRDAYRSARNSIPLLIGVKQPGAGHILHRGDRLDALATGQFLHRGLIGGWQLKCWFSVPRRHDYHLVLSLSHDPRRIRVLHMRPGGPCPAQAPGASGRAARTWGSGPELCHCAKRARPGNRDGPVA